MAFKTSAAGSSGAGQTEKQEKAQGRADNIRYDR